MQKTRIPTIIGILLAVSSVLFVSYAFNKVSPLLSHATPSQTPSEVSFSNVSDTAFTVTWTTQEASTGYISITNPANTNFIAYDDRDQSTYTTHIVTMRNGAPQTTYHILIGSNKTPYAITTGPTLENPSTLEPAYGNAMNPDGSPARNALVFITLQDSQTLSTFTSPSGTWVIPLNLIRSSDVQSYIEMSDRINETIIIQTKSGQSKAMTDTKNDNPVPTMVIGKEYDFRKIQAALLPTVKPVRFTNTKKISITNPKNNAALSTDLPLFTGTGFTGQSVLLTIGITKPITATTIVGADGLWRFTPKKPLLAGKQSVTITTKDARGESIALTNQFEILKSGTQVLGDATPSGTIAPTQTTTPTPTTNLTGDPIPQTGIQFPLIIFSILGMMLLTIGIFYV